MKDLVTIVTGTNSPTGIGRATAHQYANNGAKAVYLCDFATTYLETHKREINTLYPAVEVHVRQFDAGDEAAVQSVVDDALKRYGRLDVFFANAGVVGTPKVFGEIGGAEFMSTLRTNVLGFVSSLYVLGLIECWLIHVEQGISSRKTRLPRHETNHHHKTLPIRLHHLHSLGSRPPLQRRLNRLLRLQSQRSLHRANNRLPARRHGHPRQCYLPGVDRDGDDRRRVRPRAGARDGEEGWAVESVAAWGCCG